MNTFKSMSVMLALALGMASPYPVLADSTGNQSLGDPRTAQDVFEFECPAKTVDATADVKDRADGAENNVDAQMVVQLTKMGKGAALAVDDRDKNGNPTDGDGDGLFSPEATLVGGPGVYTVMFLKTDIGRENYVGRVNCRKLDKKGNSVINGPSLFPPPIQNE